MSISAAPAKLTFAVAATLLIAAPPARQKEQPSDLLPQSANWMEFNTDACGDVGRIETRLSPTPASISADHDDEEEWVNSWNMSPAQSWVLNEWLLRHPEIATVTGTVERLCEKPGPLDDPEEPNLA